MRCAGNIQEEKAKAGRGQRDTLSKVTKSTTRSISRAEIGNLLENFKTELLGTLSSQFDAFNAKKRQEEEKQPYLFFILNAKKNILKMNVH
jgi:hypothetical protein